MSTELTSDQLPALKRELDNDPNNFGYGAWQSGSTAVDADGTAALINKTAIGTLATRAPGETVSWAQCRSVIDWDDVLALTPQRTEVLHQLSTAGVLDPNGVDFLNLVKGAFPPSSTSRQRLIAMGQRPISRCEQLFGVGFQASGSNIGNTALL